MLPYPIVATPPKRHGRVADLATKRFGRLTAVEYLGTKRGRALWLCKCDCGTVASKVAGDLVSGRTQSCGCLQAELRGKSRLKPFGESFLRHKLAQIRIHAKYDNRECLLADRELLRLWRSNCHYCGSPPQEMPQCTLRKTGSRKFNGVLPLNGIDRVDNSKGYVAGNVVPCCWRCNQWKKALSASEFVAHAVAIAAHAEVRKESYQCS